MNREDIIKLAREAGFEELFKDSHDWVCFTDEIERFAALVAAAERKVIMDSLQKQADLATDALDRRWALEMISAITTRSNT